MHIQRILSGVFFAAFLSLVFFTILAYFNTKEAYTLYRQEQSYLAILRAVERLENNVLDMNNGATAYAIKGHPQALLQYQKGLALYPKNLKAVQLAATTEPLTRKYIRQLLANLEAFTPLPSELVRQAANRVPQMATNEELNKHLYLFRGSVKALEHQQLDLLHQADKFTQSKLTKMLRTFLVFTCFMFLFFIATYWLINKTLKSRFEASALLKEKEQIFSSLFYKSPIMLALTELSTGKILDVNDNSLIFLGYSRE